MKNQVQTSGRMIDILAPYAVVSGGGVQVGSLFGIAATSAAITEPLSIDTMGIYSIAATSADTGTAGTKVYWNDTTKAITTTAGSNVLVGVLTAAKADGELVAEVRLNGSFTI